MPALNDEAIAPPMEDTGIRPATGELRPLGPDADIPLYQRLKLAVEGTIEWLQLRHGQRIWTESQLSAQYQVSRSVVRQALVQMVREGRLSSRRGAGHFVNQRRAHKHLPVISSITADLAASGEPYAMALLDVGISPCNGDKELDLVARPSIPRVHRVRRVGTLHNEPVALLSGAYPPQFGRFLTRTAINENGVYRTLNHNGHYPSHADVIMSVEFATAEEAPLLGVLDGTPLVCIQCQTRDEHGHLIEVTRELYRADRFEFTYEADIKARTATHHTAPTSISRPQGDEH